MAADPDEQPPPEQNKKNGSCTPHITFLCTIEGILKIVEFFTVFIAWAICADAYRHIKEGYILNVRTRYTIFLIIGIICWIFVIFVILFNLLGCFNKFIHERLTRLFGWYIFLLAYTLSWFFFWFFGSILLVWHYKYWNGNAAAGFFGFVNMILFFIDSVLYYRTCRKYRVQIRKIRRGLLENENL